MSSNRLAENICSTAQVQARAKTLLQSMQIPADLEQMIYAVLQQPGQILSESGGRKTKLVSTVYTSLDGCFDERLRELATALELLIPAFDIIDDVQDGKLSDGVGRVEMGCWLNVALYLLHLGQQVLSSCDFEPCALLKAQTLFNTRVLEAVTGQHADLLSENCILDSQAALKISATKSGALMQAVFEFCAIVAEASSEVVELTGKIGRLLGTCRQLNNDMEDLRPDCQIEPLGLERIRAICNNDIGRRKKTVPVTFALNFAHQYPSEDNAFLRDYYSEAHPQPLGPTQYQLLRETIWNSGAPAYVQIVMEMHRSQAEILIAQLQEAGYPNASNLTKLFEM